MKGRYKGRKERRNFKEKKGDEGRKQRKERVLEFGGRKKGMKEAK